MNKEDELLMYAFIIIKNITSLICFTTLAVIFQKWWIVFFAIVFWTFIDNNKKDKKEV